MKHSVSNEIFSCTVTFYNRLYQVFGNIGIVCQQLLGVLGQAVAAVAKRRVVVVCADARIEADTANDGLGIKTLHFGVGIQFVEIADT